MIDIHPFLQWTPTTCYETLSQRRKIHAELRHVLAIQPLPQVARVGDCGHRSETVSKSSVHGIITRNSGSRGVVLTTKGKEEPDHVLRVAVLSFLHLGLSQFLRTPSWTNKVNTRRVLVGLCKDVLHLLKNLPKALNPWIRGPLGIKNSSLQLFWSWREVDRPL